MVSLVSKPAIDLVYDLHWISVSVWFHLAIFLKRPVDGRSNSGVIAVAAMKTSRLRRGVEKIHAPGRIFVGLSSRPQTGGQTLTNEASKGGCLRRTGICPT
jgi:hypothetical protein